MLFLIYINDLRLHFDRCLCVLYADDTTIHTNDRNITNIEETLIHDFGKAAAWCKPNKIRVRSGKKTNYVYVSRNKAMDKYVP